jgi:hypothetical protein
MLFFPKHDKIGAWKVIVSASPDFIVQICEGTARNWKNNMPGITAEDDESIRNIVVSHAKPFDSIIDKPHRQKLCYWENDIMWSIIASMVHQYHPDGLCTVMLFEDNHFDRGEPQDDNNVGVDHIISLVRWNNHFGVFDVNTKHKVIVVYDGKDITQKRKSSNRLGKEGEGKSTATSKSTAKDPEMKVWVETAKQFLLLVLNWEQYERLVVNSSVYHEDIFAKASAEDKWVLSSCAAVGDPIFRLSDEDLFTQEDSHDCGPVAILHINELLHHLTGKSPLRKLKSRLGIVNKYVNGMGPLWIMECVNFKSGSNPEAEELISKLEADTKLRANVKGKDGTTNKLTPPPVMEDDNTQQGSAGSGKLPFIVNDDGASPKSLLTTSEIPFTRASEADKGLHEHDVALPDQLTESSLSYIPATTTNDTMITSAEMPFNSDDVNHTNNEESSPALLEPSQPTGVDSSTGLPTNTDNVDHSNNVESSPAFLDPTQPTGADTSKNLPSNIDGKASNSDDEKTRDEKIRDTFAGNAQLGKKTDNPELFYGLHKEDNSIDWEDFYIQFPCEGWKKGELDMVAKDLAFFDMPTLRYDEDKSMEVIHQHEYSKIGGKCGSLKNIDVYQLRADNDGHMWLRTEMISLFLQW